MKSAIMAAGLLVALAAPALADPEEGLARIMDSVRKIAQQRDDALRACGSTAQATPPNVTLDPVWNIGAASREVIAFKILKEADRGGAYSLVVSENPDLSVCIFKLGDECVLGYDGATHAIVATRTINAWGDRAK